MSMSISQTMLAAVTSGERRQPDVRRISVPEIEPHQVLVKVKACATNPTDWKIVAHWPTEGNVIGCDFSGTIERVGSKVSGPFKLGDAVAGTVHGSTFPNGAYAEYVAVNADILLPVPKGWSFEQAAQVGVAMYTASLCLFHFLKLPSILSPALEGDKIDILVWGAASSVGQAAIQLARLGGLHVITTASPRNFELVKRLGANEVFDYSKEDTPAKIKALTNGKLRYAVDCISENGTGDQIAACVGDAGGECAIILPYEQKRKDIRTEFLVLYYIFGKDITIPVTGKCDAGQYEHRFEANKILTKALLSGAYYPCPIDIIPGGLEGVKEGLKRGMEGKIRGTKLVYRISETPQLNGA